MLSYHMRFESLSTLLSSSSLSWSSWSSSFIMCKASVGLFWPHLIVSSKVFQLVFIHLVYNSVLFLTSCSSFLLHLISNLICIFLVSCQLVVPAALPKYLYSFCGQNGCTWLFFWKILTWLMSIVKTQILHNIKHINVSQKVIGCVTIYINLKCEFTEAVQH
jgi:hypothetical protein